MLVGAFAAGAARRRPASALARAPGGDCRIGGLRAGSRLRFDHPRGNQIVSGVAINFLASGLTAFPRTSVVRRRREDAQL